MQTPFRGAARPGIAGTPPCGAPPRLLTGSKPRRGSGRASSAAPTIGQPAQPRSWHPGRSAGRAEPRAAREWVTSPPAGAARWLSDGLSPEDIPRASGRDIGSYSDRGVKEYFQMALLFLRHGPGNTRSSRGRPMTNADDGVASCTVRPGESRGPARAICARSLLPSSSPRIFWPLAPGFRRDERRELQARRP